MAKFGLRTPSPKRSLKARTSGKLKRSVNRSFNPLYGKKGAGFVKNPKKSLQNSNYHRTTVGLSDIGKGGSNRSNTKQYKYNDDNSLDAGCGCLLICVLVIVGITFMFINLNATLVLILIAVAFWLFATTRE